MSRKKKIVKNLVSEILPQILILFLGLLRSKYYLDYLGSNNVGLVNLFNQIISYLSLVEGGIGHAIVYKLYEPISKGYYQKLAELRNGTKKIFNRIILIIIFLSVICGLLIPFLIKNNQFGIFYILINFILYAISEIILYMTVFERSIYIASEKSYKINYVIKTSLIIKYLLQITFSILFQNLTIIFIALIIVGLLENIIIKVLTKKDFNKLPYTKREDISFVKEIKNILVHKIAGTVANNIDIVLISKFIGLNKVLIYSTYLMYANSIISLTNKISQALLGTVGNILVEDKKKAYKTFTKYNGLVFILAILIAGPFNLLINYFIKLFYNGKVEVSIITSSLFTLILIYNIIRLPLITYTEGAGLFKETKICPIIESIVNLVLSVILVNILGINGCLLGTVISLIISEYFIKPKIIYKNLFDVDVKKYYLINIKYIILLVLQIVLCYLAYPYLNVTSFTTFLIYLMVCGIVNLIITLIILKLMKQEYLFDIIKIIIKKMRRK